MLTEDPTVEVVFRKKMTLSQYRQLRPKMLEKGYFVQAYQDGFYQPTKV